jgi:hypothetical protein
MLSLEKLCSAVGALLVVPAPLFQRTLEATVDLTGYLTTETYAISNRTMHLPGIPYQTEMSPQEEEVRKEIRALKGLVLNR